MSLLAGFIVPHPPIIIPDIGRGEERKIMSTIKAYDEISLKIAQLKPRVIIVVTPHHDSYHDYFHISPGEQAWGSLEQFNSIERFKVTYHTSFISRFHELYPDFPAGGKGEKDKNLDHGVMIPLYFIQKYYQDFELIRISLSGLPLKMHHSFGAYIDETMASLKEDYVVASGDLSHKLMFSGPYGFVEEGPKFDEMMINFMANGDFHQMMAISPKIYHKAGECGLKTFVILGGILEKYFYLSKLLSYEGPFGVGYAVASYMPNDPYVLLAKKTLEDNFRDYSNVGVMNRFPTEMLEEKAGVFVSIKKHGQLRGCIGTIFPTTKSIKEEVIQNTLSAAFNDPRFPPISDLELNDLIFSVDILKKPEVIHSKDLLDISKYGVIVRWGHRRGLLLPNIDGVHNVDEQIEIALKKAGINKRDDYELSRFEVVRHIEK